MKATVAVVVLILGAPLVLNACLWDRDTPASEAKGMPEVVAVLSGRFERNPPLYYEMRLKRVAAHLEKHPEDLSAYDDAGVACDRLGRGDEAIGWMNKKREQLQKTGGTSAAVKEQLYRYYANQGTFLVHRWVRQGGDRARIEEVKNARDAIARALEINPDAHFGREKYQLLAIDWIIAPPPAKTLQGLPNLLGWSFDDIYGVETDPNEADKAVRGLAGLVVLGNAWESVDIFYALNVALQRDSVGYPRGRDGGRNTLAYLAWLRCEELIGAGKGSMLPDAPKGEALKAMLRYPDFVSDDTLLRPMYKKLRENAEAWHKARAAFMTRRMADGLHPDTHSNFWDGYHEVPAISLSVKSVPDAYHARVRLRQRLALAAVVGVPTLLAGFLAWLRFSLAKRQAPAAHNTPEQRSEEIL